MSEEDEIALRVLYKLQGKAILWGDGIHDDTEGIDAFNFSRPVYWSTGEKVDDVELLDNESELSHLNSNRSFWLPTNPYSSEFYEDIETYYFPGSTVCISSVNPRTHE